MQHWNLNLLAGLPGSLVHQVPISWREGNIFGNAAPNGTKEIDQSPYLAMLHIGLAALADYQEAYNGVGLTCVGLTGVLYPSIFLRTLFIPHALK